MEIAEHLVATTRHRDRTLTDPDRAAWLWVRLRAVIETVLSLVLMPDHLHLVAPPGALLRLRGVLSGFTARFGVRFDVEHVERATTPAVAGRMMRYGFHNAVRAGLVSRHPGLDAALLCLGDGRLRAGCPGSGQNRPTWVRSLAVSG